MSDLTFPFLLCPHTDPASSKPNVLLHASVPVVVPSLRDVVQPPHRACFPILHFLRQTDVYGQWSNSDPFPGNVMLGEGGKSI